MIMKKMIIADENQLEYDDSSPFLDSAFDYDEDYEHEDYERGPVDSKVKDALKRQQRKQQSRTGLKLVCVDGKIIDSPPLVEKKEENLTSEKLSIPVIDNFPFKIGGYVPYISGKLTKDGLKFLSYLKNKTENTIITENKSG